MKDMPMPVVVSCVVVALLIDITFLSGCKSTPELKAPSEIKPQAHGIFNSHEANLGLKMDGDVKVLGRYAEEIKYGRPAFRLNGQWVRGYTYGGSKSATSVIGRWPDGRWDFDNMNHEFCHCLQFLNRLAPDHRSTDSYKGRTVDYKQFCKNWYGAGASTIMYSDDEGTIIFHMVDDITIQVLSGDTVAKMADEARRFKGE